MNVPNFTCELQSTEVLNKIFKGLTQSNAFEIHFPKPFTYIMKILKIMPNWLYLKLIKKGMQLIGR